MTVPTSDNREEYTGNDVTTSFDYAFKIFEDSDLQVYLQAADGTETLLVLNTDYSVSGAGDLGGGSVTYPLSGDPLASDEKLIILRVLEVVQETDLRNQGAYYPQVIEDELDRSRMIDQQQQEEINRALKRPAAEDGYDAGGRQIKNGAAATDGSDFVIKSQVDNRFASDVITKTAGHWDGKGLRLKKIQTDAVPELNEAINWQFLQNYVADIEAGNVGDASLVTALDSADQRALNAWMKQVLENETAVNQRTIYVGSVAELEALSLSVGTNVYLTQDGRAGEFVVKAGTPPSDPQKGIYIILANGNYAERQYTGPIKFRWFDAAANGTTDDKAAITAACNYLQSIGGGALDNEGLDIAFSPTVGAFASNPVGSLNGIAPAHIIGGGSFIDLTSTYNTSEYALLFKLEDCERIKLDFRVQSYEPVTETTEAENVGLQAVLLKGACKQIENNVVTQGCRNAISCSTTDGTQATPGPIGLTGKIKSYRTHYPLEMQFSGDNSDLDLDVEACGRPYIIYGMKNVDLRVHSKNPRKSAIVATFEGSTASGINIYHEDKDTTSSQLSQPLIAVNFSDITAGTIEDLNLTLNTKTTSTTGWGNTVEVNKFQSPGVPDPTGRGHKLINFKISGISDMTGTTNQHIVNPNGSFVSGSDIVSGFSAENLKLYGAGSSVSCGWNLAAVDSPSFYDVFTEASVYPFTTNGETAVFYNCKAAFLSNGSGDASKCYYENCEITGAFSGISVDENKRFVNCEILGARFDQTTFGGRGSANAANYLIGDLTPQRRLFKVRASSSGMFRLKYHLCSDITDTSPLSRDETFGVKTFSATVDSAGTWVLQQAAVDEVTERFQNTAAALTITLVNGTSAGAFIEVAATNYNGLSARGSFALEHLSLYEVGAVYPDL